MENELIKAHETFDIEGVGEFKTRKGTAVHQLAGAASYWEHECKILESKLLLEFGIHLDKVSKGKWRDGFLTGAVSTAVLAILTVVSFRLFW